MEIDVKIKKTTGETERIKYGPQKKYDKENTVQIKMKLNKKTDADIIEFLQTLDNRQGYLKELIREDMKKVNKD